MNSLTSALRYVVVFAMAIAAAMRASAQLADLAALESGREAEALAEQLSANWSDAEVFALRVFSEPLVADPSQWASAEENAAFFTAMGAYLLSRQTEVSEGFLRAWPQSRWAAALSHNLGVLKYREGRFSAAIEYWENSWKLGRNSKDERLRALADRSLAELAQMHAKLGRIEALPPLLETLRRDEVGGASRQMLDASAEALHEMEADPGKSFKCGPFALADVRRSLGIPDAMAQAIRDTRSRSDTILPSVPAFR